MTPEKRIDDALDTVLRASGSRLANYTMQKSLDDMRAAMRKVMSDAYIAGVHAEQELRAYTTANNQVNRTNPRSG